jgi:hypothetical protein
VRVTSSNQEPEAASVGELSSRLRIRFRSDRVQEVMRAGNVALVTVQRTFQADEVEINGRLLSVATTDITFATTEHWTDTEASGDYIKRVQGTGELESPDESVIELPLDVDADA